MRKKICGLALALLLCAAALAGCGAQQPDEGPVTHGSGLAQGTLDGNTYTLAGIGMELRIPENFEVFTGKPLDQMIKGGASAFYRFAARNKDRQEVVTFFVPNTDQQAAAYLEDAKKQLHGARDQIGEIEQRTLGGFVFQALRAEVESDGQSLVEWSFAYEQDGKLFCLGDVCLTEDEQDMLKGLDEMIVKTEAAAE